MCELCYHPPKPLYDPQSLIHRISAGMKEILSSMPGVMVCLAGDLNQQKTDV